MKSSSKLRVPTTSLDVTQHTIGLLISDAENRRILAEFIQQLGYAVSAGDASTSRLESWSNTSLIIADELAARHKGQILLYMKDSSPVFLPLLIAVPQNAGSSGWLQAGFDDMVRLPMLRAELGARLSAFLKLREQSAAQYQSIFENAPLGIFRTTLKGQVLMANRALVEMLGFASSEEMAEDNLGAIASHKGFPRVWAGAQLKKSGQALGMESSWQRPDGRTVHIRVNVVLIKDNEGNPLWYEGMVEDVTKRRLAEERTKQREALLSEILDALPQALVAIDGSGKILRVSEAPEESDYTPGGLLAEVRVGGNYLEVYRRAAAEGDEWARQGLEGIQQVLAGQRASFNLEYPWPAPTGEHWFRMCVSPLQEAVQGAVITHIPISNHN
jgi:PAS domain S-box-containing protein